MFLIWYVGGLILLGVLLIVLSDGDGGGYIIGFLGVVIVGILLIFVPKPHHGRDNIQAYRQLKHQGWNISKKDVDTEDNDLHYGCLHLDLHKINDVWHVTTDRSKSVGGGYIIMKPSIRPAVEAICS